MEYPQNETDGSMSLLQRLSVKLLRPVIGILMRTGVPYDTFARMARQQYVEIARNEFGLRGRKTNVARVAMMTGLTRSAVKREIDSIEREEAGADVELLDKVRHASRMLLGWHTDARFLDDGGAPKVLPLKDAPNSFEDLYEAFSGKAVPITSMLKELINVGAVRELDSGHYQALSRTYKPEARDIASVERVCQALNDMSNTALHNLYRSYGASLRFERFATNQLIPEDKEVEFYEFLDKEGQAFLEKADNWLSKNESSDKSITKKRIGVGLYQVSSEPIKQVNTENSNKLKGA